MPQLVGSNCEICDERITNALDAESCTTCESVVHHVCKSGGTEEPGRCSSCGARARELENVTVGGNTKRSSVSLISHLFSFHGRIPRGTYFAHSVLGSFVVVALIGGIGIAAVFLGEFGALFGTVAVFGVLFAYMWSETAVTVKRLHDIGRPGMHWFLLLLPVYNMYLSLVLLFQPGAVGDNEYGKDPVGHDDSRGESLLTAANRHEMNGDWGQAFELYRLAAQKLDGQPDREYAVNCIKRLQEKVTLGQASDST